jgi:RNA polymerase sigma-70 factor (ECF subfamily)
LNASSLEAVRQQQKASLGTMSTARVSPETSDTESDTRTSAFRGAPGEAPSRSGMVADAVVVDGPAVGDAIDEAPQAEGEMDQAAEVAPKPIDPAKAEFLKVLQRAKEGDKKAFEEIFQMYHRRIYNAVYGMLGDADDAQDVTQDVFMRLHDALPTLRADEAFSTYLYRIALNLCRDRARRKKRVRFQSMDTPRVDDEGSAEPMEFPDAGKLPEETVNNDELQKRVRQAVSTLSTDHKSVIVMHHFQGMEVNDIARILNVPTGTVKSRLARGRDQLHRKLRTYLNL